METVRPGVATEEQRAALREMLSRCDMPTRYRFPSIKGIISKLNQERKKGK